MKDERNDGLARPQPNGRPPSGSGPWRFRLAALGLVAVSAVAGVGMAALLRQSPPASPPAPEPPPLKLPGHLFRGWDKPDLVVLLSAQQHGYLQPCGCSHPQKGGLERRYNLARLLREERGWPLAAFDLGDVPQRHGPADLPNLQGLIKYRYAMAAMREIGYSAVGVGEFEAAQPLFQTLGEWAVNEPAPRVVCANLEDDLRVVRPWEELKTVKGSVLKVGATALVGQTQRDAIAKLFENDATNRPRFQDSAPALRKVLEDMAAKGVHFPVLLYHGQARTDVPGKTAEAVSCAKAFPQFPVILCLDETDEASSSPEMVKHADGRQTMLVTLGHKGKSVGVVGVWRTGKKEAPYDLRYQLVELGEEFVTPRDRQADHPVGKLMERYTQELKKGDYLARYPQRTHEFQAGAAAGKETTYVGSEACKSCHQEAYKVWKKSGHAHAYQTLEEAKHPSLRQYDPECIVCHTVGFGYRSGFADAVKTPKLKDVGCESCHGPGGAHVAAYGDTKWHALMNPWKAPDKETAKEKEARELRIDLMCQKCHDSENDVQWKGGGFGRKWPIVVHHTPAE